MTAEQMKQLKDLVLDCVVLNEYAENEIVIDRFLSLIEWVDKLNKEVK